jgi:hypothetical protein
MRTEALCALEQAFLGNDVERREPAAQPTELFSCV